MIIKNKEFDLKLKTILMDFYEVEISIDKAAERIEELYNSINNKKIQEN